MSKFAVEVVRINEVKEHPDADALEIAMIEGSMWQTVVPKGQYKAGDTAIYVPVDAVVPVEISDVWGVTKYLSKQRVRAARLRGQMSYGFLANSVGFEVGTDLTEYFGITKYEPPVHLLAGDMERPIGGFIQYTDIENIQNWPGIFQEGENVVATEKRHGTNCRVGYHFDPETMSTVIVCGSRTHRRKLAAGSIYEIPLSDTGIVDCLRNCGNGTIIFGELFGGNIQGKAFPYGSPNKPVFEAFDIWCEGSYMDWDPFLQLCEGFSINTVPTLYTGPFSRSGMESLSSGQSITDPNTVKEGIVIKPVKERHDPALGRVVLKWKNDEYLLNKHST